MCKDISWSEQHNFRREAAARFGPIFSLPIIKRVRDVLLDCVRDHARVLEVGAGDRRMRRLLAERRAGIEYRSLDIDAQGEHDYRSFAEVDGRFDCVFAFEVVEHVAFDELPAWLRSLSDALAPGGKLLLSTPNTYYPPAYLRDASHRTPLCYDELAGLVRAAGFEVSRIVRVYHDPVHRALLRRYAFGWLFRLIGIDFARQIVLVADKPAR
jgi:SAM-dependent methyltransferase